MKDQFRLTENEIERKKGMLHLHAEGVLVHPVVNGKLRILSVSVSPVFSMAFITT